ncbi:MAG: fasciclin domain-containing protein [Chromatiaceae bacterium]|nr:fasciclin domain-containing protein [Chromatiaceae bacterium]
MAAALALTATSPVQADPRASGALAPTATPGPRMSITSEVRPDGARPGVPSRGLLESLGHFVDGAGSVAFFNSLLRAASLGDLLDLRGTYTLFVPVDAAFSRMSGERIAELIHDSQSLRSLIAAHVVPGRVLKSDLTPGAAVRSVSGDRIEASTADGLQVNGANLITTAFLGSVVVHVVDRLLPGSAASDA